jgi:uncharacterized Rmd1/YagE family protein
MINIHLHDCEKAEINCTSHTDGDLKLFNVIALIGVNAKRNQYFRFELFGVSHLQVRKMIEALEKHEQEFFAEEYNEYMQVQYNDTQTQKDFDDEIPF